MYYGTEAVKDYRVLLNGKPLEDVAAADTDQNMVAIYEKHHRTGEFVDPYPGGETVGGKAVLIIKGAVTIEKIGGDRSIVLDLIAEGNTFAGMNCREYRLRGDIYLKMVEMGNKVPWYKIEELDKEIPYHEWFINEVRQESDHEARIELRSRTTACVNTEDQVDGVYILFYHPNVKIIKSDEFSDWSLSTRDNLEAKRIDLEVTGEHEGYSEDLHSSELVVSWLGRVSVN